MLNNRKAIEWADKLSGREYGDELTLEEERQAKDDGVIIIFGASDDLLEFRGAVNDEVNAINGAKVRLTTKPSVFSEKENAETYEYNQDQINDMPIVKATFCPKDHNGNTWATWEVNTNISHAVFYIMEEGEYFCRGIVISGIWQQEG
jgi:hypothetical protein